MYALSDTAWAIIVQANNQFGSCGASPYQRPNWSASSRRGAPTYPEQFIPKGVFPTEEQIIGCDSIEYFRRSYNAWDLWALIVGSLLAMCVSGPLEAAGRRPLYYTISATIHASLSAWHVDCGYVIPRIPRAAKLFLPKYNTIHASFAPRVGVRTTLNFPNGQLDR